ncbi:response regulator [Terrabacter sp. BE26]|uniref:response regulator n=1 Tax=Terrabacter sp. BE26 TaxID=2898152 RepID=UPI0035BE7669
MSDVQGVGGAEGDDLFRWMVAASPDGLWVFDEEGRTLFANERMAQLLGRDPDDMVGFSVFEAVDDVGKVQFREHLRQLATHGEPGDNLECSLLDAKGNRFWALVSHTPLVDETGVRRGWMHRVSEHSAQRRLLDQLAEAQAIARIGSWEWNVVEDRLSWSEELSRIYGLAPDEAVPSVETFIGRIHRDDRGQVREVIRAALESEDSSEFEARLVRADGETRWIRGRGRVTRDAEGRPVRMGGTTQDITERKVVEVALAMVTAMATAANESATLAEALPAVLEEIARHTTWRPVLACQADEDGRLQEPMLPPAAVEASPLPVEAGMDVATRAAACRSVVLDQSAEGSTILAVPVVDHDVVACVVVLDLRTTAPPAESDVAAIEQITAIFARVADRERTADHLAQARDAAMEASRAKSQFLATMSHEIRTPLNGVIGLAELLGRTELTAHQRRLSDGIEQAGHVLLALVNDILDLSKIEAGRLELESVDFDPTAVLEGSVALLAERARAKSLELSVTHGPDVPALVSGDPVRFGQVVANLTTNAVKFTDSGSVAVHLEVLRTGDHGPELRVEVRDTGSGITAGVRSRLFQSFSQGDSSTTRQYGGTGLGLAISRQIVTALGGQIGVESEPGVGATFWFTAAFEPASDQAPGRGATYAASVSGLRALVVGADATRRQRIEEQLRAWSVAVTSASTGVDGLVQLDRAHGAGRPLDVVVLDDPAVGESGLQVSRRIRSDGRFEGVRVVLVCAQLPPPDVAATTDAGVDAVLTSPVMPSTLFDAMADAAGRHLAAALTDPGGPGGASGASRSGGGGRGGSAPAPVRPVADVPLGTLLVVEDNEVNQLVAQGVLESLGYAVRLAANGVEGVAAHREHCDEIVAVLMDCQMPRMDGYEATRVIRAQEEPGQRVPVIAMTASAIAGERERCLRAGMDDFLTKPIDVALLASTLQRWVGPPAAADHALVRDGAGPSAEAPEGALEVDGGLDSPVVEVGQGVLDLHRLEELRDLEPGDPSLLLRFIDRFGTGARQRLEELRAAHRGDDAEAQGRVAHGLKGSAANLGAAALAAVSKQVEDLGSAGRLADAALLDRIADEVDRATSALEAYAAALRSSG